MALRRVLFCVIAVAAFAAPGAAARAATIVVDATGDASEPGKCTLRNAIEAANGDTEGDGRDTIEFALPSPSTITVAAGLPTIIGELDVDGPGAGALTVSGGDASRVFTVAAVDASISALTIADGKSGVGAGVRNEPGS